MKKRTKTSALERKKEVVTNLTHFGGTLYEQMEDGTFPWAKMPSRSIENIYYNPELRQYILGDKTVRRSAGNIRHIRPFTQLVWAAYFAQELTKQRKTSTLRDVYYSAQAFDIAFKDQAESNNVITDLETVANFSREDFNVFPEERSAIFGDLTIEYTVPGYEGKRLNLTSHPDGVMIGPALTSSEFVKTSADKVIAIEKGGLFTRFIEEQVHKKYNALLVLTAGQAPRATRHFIHRLNGELDLPVYIFSVDGEENILIEKNGLLKTVRIKEFVDNLVTDNSNPTTLQILTTPLRYERSLVKGYKSVAVTSDGHTLMGDILAASRHEIFDDLYQIITKGGYSVCVTSSHSVMVYEDYKLVPKAVDRLQLGDLLAISLKVPSKEDITELNLSELIMNESAEMAEKVWVVGDECEKLECRYSDNVILWRRIKRKTVPLKEFFSRRRIPQLGMLKWQKSEIRLPIRMKIAAEFCRLLGYYAAEGCLPKQNRTVQLSFGIHEKEYIEDATSCVKKTFGCPVKIYNVGSECILRFGGVLLWKLFKQIFKAGESAVTKSIPWVILNVPNEMKKEFLKGYYRGDRRAKFNIINHELQTSTVSKKLASDIVFLLAQLDIIPAIEHKKPGKPHVIQKTGQLVKFSNPYYVVTIRDRESLTKLKDIVLEFGGEKVQSYLSEKVKKSPIWYSLPVELIFPLRKSLRKEVKSKFQKELEVFLQHGIYGYKRVSYRILRRIFENLNDASRDFRLTFLKNLIQNKIVLCPIVNIKKVKPSSNYVYDIEVANTHTFVGGLGPLVLHNTDGDPWGMHIAMVIISGSANAAHLRELTTPDAKWSGVWASDIVEYKLPSDPLTDLDIKRLYELQKDPRYEGELWQRETKTFLKIKKKAEQEAFSRYGLTYIVDEYLPTKLEQS